MGLGGSRQAGAADGSSQPDSVYWAAYFGRVVDLRRMLDAGADVNQRESEYNRTPLIATAFKDRWEAALLLLERGARLEEREESLGCTALMISAQYNSVSVAQVLLEAGADPDAGNDQHGQTALMWCCQYDHAQLASILLSHGASVSKQRKDTVTPLMIAAKNNAYSVAALLLDTGADPNLVGNGRFTALMICAMVDSLEVAQLLLRHGADKAAANREGKTALILCGENNSFRVAQLLLDTGTDADAVCSDNQHSVATVAALRGHLDLLRLLVEHGANFRHRCADGRGLVELAAGSGSQPMILYARRLIGDSFAAVGTAELHWAASSDDKQTNSRQQHQQQQQQRGSLYRKEDVRSRDTAEALEEAVTTTHEELLSPNTAVPSEQQLPDDQKQREALTGYPEESTVEPASAVAVEATSAADEAKADENPNMDETAEVTEDVVMPAYVAPLGPNTFVPFEQQLLDDKRRAEKAATPAGSDVIPASVWQGLMGAEDEAVQETVTATQVRPLGPDTAVSFEQQQRDDQKRAVSESVLDVEINEKEDAALKLITNLTQGEDTIMAEESADEAIRAWESLAELGRSGAEQEEKSEATLGAVGEQAEVSEEPVAAVHVRPLGPNTGVPFEQQLLDDEKRAAAAALLVVHEAAGEEAVTATYEQPQGPNTAFPSEEQLPDDQKRKEADMSTTSNTRSTTVSKQQQKSAKFPNKKRTVTRKLVTTETTGELVTKREVIVKIAIASEEASESVIQIEGPPQRPKWKSRRDSESQFQKGQ